LLPFYDWSRADWLSLANLVFNLDCSGLFDVIIDPNADWSMLYNSLVNFFNICVPVFISSGSHSVKFDSIRKKVPRTIANLQNKKLKVWSKLRTSPDDQIIVQRYIDCTFSIKAKFNSIKLSNDSKILQSINVGAVYRHINARLTHKAGIAPLFDNNGCLV